MVHGNGTLAGTLARWNVGTLARWNVERLVVPIVHRLSSIVHRPSSVHFHASLFLYHCRGQKEARTFDEFKSLVGTAFADA
jgi:hypothetical protein